METPPTSEHGLNGFERRRRIYATLSTMQTPPTDAAFAERFGVSEAIIRSDTRRIANALNRKVAAQAKAAGKLHLFPGLEKFLPPED